MKQHFKYFVLITLLFSGTLFLLSNSVSTYEDGNIIYYIADPKTQDIKLYYKNDEGEQLNSIGNLVNLIKSKNKKLLFAMNGGMYMENRNPLGLFIQDKKTIVKLNKKSGTGNFYTSPNGVFYISTDNIAQICKTTDFPKVKNANYATQSGPMLVVEGKINSIFSKDSKKLNIRNGVGILPNNKVVFAMSKDEISFYNFANYFKTLGCKNALYLDGFVCRTYLPEKKWIQIDGDFGVMIGVTNK